jgi:hypothetical protein
VARSLTGGLLIALCWPDHLCEARPLGRAAPTGLLPFLSHFRFPASAPHPSGYRPVDDSPASQPAWHLF